MAPETKQLLKDAGLVVSFILFLGLANGLIGMVK